MPSGIPILACELAKEFYVNSFADKDIYQCQDLTIIFFLFLLYIGLRRYISKFGVETTSLGLCHRSSAHYIIRLIYLDHDHYLSQGSSAVITFP